MKERQPLRVLFASGTEEERLAPFERVLTEIQMRLHAFVPVALRDRGASGAAVLAP